jgi:lipopolysaccharide export LptBFGC system permease protein LptF
LRLLSRYLLRQLAAPFLFGLGALTSLMLLSQIAKKFGALVGKGLSWGVIAEVFALSLPFIVAMTIPMAVLLAVLYAFSHLAADNEITAMRASGISVYQVLAPVLAWGVVMSVLNFGFVDQVLPRTNARLRGLLIDIGRKKPTLELREQVINEVPPSQYFLRAGRIDAATGRLKDITIYDMGGESSRRIIYADSGLMAYNEGRTDLNLRLYDGSIHQYRPSDPLSFQLTYYHVNNIRVKDVYDELVRNSTETVRGDREMSTCEMLSVIRDARTDQRNAEQDQHALLIGDLRTLLHLPPVGPPATAKPATHLPAYCGWISRIQMAFSKTAEPPATAQVDSGQVARQGARPAKAESAVVASDAETGAAAGGRAGQTVRRSDSQTIGQPVGQQPLGRQPVGPAAAVQGASSPGRPGVAARAPATRPVAPIGAGPRGAERPLSGRLQAVQAQKAAAEAARAQGKQGVARPGVRQQGTSRPGQTPGAATPASTRAFQKAAAAATPAGVPQPSVARLRLSNWAQVATATDRRQEASGRVDRYEVEVHKKWSISFACISFVIIGVVMALRFPRGGIGLVIGGGLLVFAVHYIGLTAGESLADRGLVSPWAAMWTPNIVLTVVGLIGLIRVSRESGSTRGGDLQEVVDGVRHLVRRLRRRLAAPAGEAA